MEFFTILCVLLIGGLKAKNHFSSFEDDEMVERAKQGDRAAFDKLYNKYKRPILNYIYRLIGDFFHAEELTQETFIRVYGNIGRYVKKTKFSSWVYAIAGNLAKNFLRDRSRKYEISINKQIATDQEGEISLLDVLAHEGKGPEEHTLSKETEEVIQKGINKLRPKHKEVIILCDIEGLPYEDAAKILKCPSATVGSRLSRARENLARILGFMKERG